MGLTCMERGRPLIQGVARPCWLAGAEASIGCSDSRGILHSKYLFTLNVAFPRCVFWCAKWVSAAWPCGGGGGIMQLGGVFFCESGVHIDVSSLLLCACLCASLLSVFPWVKLTFAISKGPFGACTTKSVIHFARLGCNPRLTITQHKHVIEEHQCHCSPHIRPPREPQ